MQESLAAANAASLSQLLSCLRSVAVAASSAAQPSGVIGQAATAPLRRAQLQQAATCSTASDMAAMPSASSSSGPMPSSHSSSNSMSSQQRRGSSLFGVPPSSNGSSSSRAGPAGSADMQHSRSMHTGSRTFASQPAYAWDEEKVGEAEDLEHDLSEPTALPMLKRVVQPAAPGGGPALEGGGLPAQPPWETIRLMRAWKTMQYRRELFNSDLWAWGGHHSSLPFLGHSRFDPATLHGPLLATSEDWEQHVERLAAQPRVPPVAPLPTSAYEPAVRSAAAAAAAAEEQQLGEQDGEGEGEEGERAPTIFDHHADLARFTRNSQGKLQLRSIIRGRPRLDQADPQATSPQPSSPAPRRRRTKEEIAEAATAAAAEAAEAEAEAALLRESAISLRATLPRQLSLQLPASQRRLVDMSATLPAVAHAMRAAGLEVDAGLEKALRRVLSRVDLDAQMLPRVELGDTKNAPIEITPESAGAMVALLVQELGMPLQRVQRMVRRSPWVLGLDRQHQVQPVLEFLHDLLGIKEKQIAKMIAQQPRVLVAQVDDHLLPLMDYLHGLGFSVRHIRRMVNRVPQLCENYTLELLRTCVAFWLGKGMSRHDLVPFLVQYPQIIQVDRSVIQLKFDWLKEHLGYSVEDHARNPALLARSLTENMGPRIAYTLQQGITVRRPSDGSKKARHGTGVTTAKEITQLGLVGFLKRIKADKADFLSFKEHWVQQELPAWLEQRQDLDYYHSLSWLQTHDREEKADREEKGPREKKAKAAAAKEEGKKGSSSSSSSSSSKAATL